MHLGPQRVREVVRANLDAGTLLTCHDTLPYGAHPEVEPAMCRGYWDAYADRTRVWQVMAALFGDHWWVEVDPPGTTPGLT